MLTTLALALPLALPQEPAPSSRLERIRTRCQAALKEHHAAGQFPGGSAALVLPTGELLTFATGRVHEDEEARLTSSSRFLTGSVGKTYVSACVLRLVHAGRLDLDAPIAPFFAEDEWFPRVPNAAGLTLRNLLRHESGLPRWILDPAVWKLMTDEPDKVWTLAQRMEFVLDREPLFAPGAGWAYADTNYLLAGAVLERVAGKPFEELVGSYLLEPHDLGDTLLSNRRELPGVVQGKVLMTRALGLPERSIEDGLFVVNPQVESFGGGFASTASDLARWARILYSGEAFDGPYLDALEDTVPAAMLGPAARYGLGVIERSTQHGKLYGHDGIFPGYAATMGWFPAARMAGAFLINADGGQARGKPLHTLLEEFVGIALEELAEEELSVLWHVPLRSTSFGAAAAADVDGDGKLELAFATYFGDSAVHVLNGEDGSELWRYQGGGASTEGECFDASLRFTDLDGDGRLELVVPVSSSSLVLAFDARTGAQRWTYVAGPGECIDTPPAIVDVDGDGSPEITVGTFKGKLHVVRASGARLRTLQVAGTGSAVQSGAAILDVNGDGVLDFVCADFNGEQSVRAVSGIEPEGDAAPEELWRVAIGKSIYHGCSQADLDGDGTPELLIAAYDGRVYALRARDGEVLWKAAPGERYIMAPTSIGDLDGDGEPEIVATSDRVSVLNADGSVLWSQPVEVPGGTYGISRGAALADMDGDGGLDVIVTTGAGALRVLRGSDGEELYAFDASSVHDEPCRYNSHGPTVADFDGDGRLDVFFVVGGDMREKHGRAICVTGFAGTGPGWYAFRHDRRNTGNVETELEPALARAIPGLR